MSADYLRNLIQESIELVLERQGTVDSVVYSNRIYNDILNGLRKVPERDIKEIVLERDLFDEEGLGVSVDDVTSEKFNILDGYDLVFIPGDNKTHGAILPDKKLIIIYNNGRVNSADLANIFKKSKPTMIHELNHAITNDKSKGKATANYKTAGDSADSYKEYVNQADEINAFFNSAVSEVIDETKDSKYQTEFVDFNYFLKALKRKFKNYNTLSKNNKKKFNGRAYTTFQLINNKYSTDSSEDRYKSTLESLDAMTPKTLKETIELIIDMYGEMSDRDAFDEAFGLHDKSIKGRWRDKLQAAVNRKWNELNK